MLRPSAELWGYGFGNFRFEQIELQNAATDAARPPALVYHRCFAFKENLYIAMGERLTDVPSQTLYRIDVTTRLAYVAY